MRYGREGQGEEDVEGIQIEALDSSRSSLAGARESGEKELREQNFLFKWMLGTTTDMKKKCAGTVNDDDDTDNDARDGVIKRKTQTTNKATFQNTPNGSIKRTSSGESIDTATKPSSTSSAKAVSRPSILRRYHSLNASSKNTKFSDVPSTRSDKTSDRDFDYDHAFPINNKNGTFTGRNEASNVHKSDPQTLNVNSSEKKKSLPSHNRHSSRKIGHMHKNVLKHKDVAERVSFVEFVINRAYLSLMSVIPIETSVFGTLPPRTQVGIALFSAAVLCIVFIYLFILNYDHYNNFRYTLLDISNHGYNHDLDSGYGQSICTQISKSLGTETLTYYECRNSSYHVIIMTLGLTMACTLVSIPFVVLLFLPLLYLYLHAYNALPYRSLFSKQSKKAALDEIIENILRHRDTIPDESLKASLLKDLVTDLVSKILTPTHSHHRKRVDSYDCVSNNGVSHRISSLDSHKIIDAPEVTSDVNGCSNTSNRTAIIKNFNMSSSNTLFLLGDDHVLNANNMASADITSVIETLQKSMGGFDYRIHDTYKDHLVNRTPYDEFILASDNRDNHIQDSTASNLLPSQTVAASPSGIESAANFITSASSPLNINVNTVNIISVDDLVENFINKYSDFMELEGHISDTNANSESLDSEDDASIKPVSVRKVKFKNVERKVKVKNVRFEDFEDCGSESHIIDVRMPSKLLSFDDISLETPVKVAKRRYHKKHKKSSPNASSSFTKPRSSSKKSKDLQEDSIGLGSWFSFFLPTTPTSADKK